MCPCALPLNLTSLTLPLLLIWWKEMEASVSISITSAIVYIVSGLVFFGLVFLLVMMGVTNCNWTCCNRCCCCCCFCSSNCCKRRSSLKKPINPNHLDWSFLDMEARKKGESIIPPAPRRKTSVTPLYKWHFNLLRSLLKRHFNVNTEFTIMSF